MLLYTTVNGIHYSREIPPGRRLVDFLRYDLFLTGTKEGCGEGECGACTVLLDGQPVNSCLIFAAQVANREILTIEGICNTERGKRLIDAFAQNGAIQCGFCTPGLIVVSYSLLTSGISLPIEEVKRALVGNLCRCTGYQKIVAAIQTVQASPPSADRPIRGQS